MKNFGQRLRELRTEKKLTQKELATQLQVTISTLSHWECGYQEPSFKDLASIGDFFKVSTDYLIGREDDFGNIVINEKSPAPALTQAEQDLLDDFRSVPRPEQAQIAEYAHYVADRHATSKQQSTKKHA